MSSATRCRGTPEDRNREEDSPDSSMAFDTDSLVTTRSTKVRLCDRSGPTEATRALRNATRRIRAVLRMLRFEGSAG